WKSAGRNRLAGARGYLSRVSSARRRSRRGEREPPHLDCTSLRQMAALGGRPRSGPCALILGLPHRPDPRRLGLEPPSVRAAPLLPVALAWSRPDAGTRRYRRLDGGLVLLDRVAPPLAEARTLPSQLRAPRGDRLLYRVLERAAHDRLRGACELTGHGDRRSRKSLGPAHLVCRSIPGPLRARIHVH